MNARRIVCLFVLMLTICSAEQALAGKLGGIRAAAKGSSKPAASKPSRPAPRPDDNDDHDEDSSSHREPRKSRREEVRTARSGKLSSIRSAVTHEPKRNEPHHHTSPRPPARSHRRGRPRRYGYDRGGFNFYSHYSPPVCLPTVVEEHHYYEPSPVVAAEPVVLPAAPPVEYVQETVVVQDDPFDTLSAVQVRFEIDYATDEADVDRSGFGLLLNATGGLGIDTGVRIFREDGADFRDHLWLGDFNVMYELFPTEFTRTRAGVGVNWLADRYGAEAGLNLTVGTDLFAGPLVFSGEADLGTLGDADLFHGRLTAAIRQGDHLEWFAGYDYLDIGGTEIRGVVGGLRFRF